MCGVRQLCTLSVVLRIVPRRDMMQVCKRKDVEEVMSVMTMVMMAMPAAVDY